MLGLQIAIILVLCVDQRAQLVEVRRPTVFLAQVKGSWNRAHLLDDAPDLHVVGHHHHHLVAGLEERMAGDEVGLGGAVGDEHVVDGLSLVKRSDPFSRGIDRWSGHNRVQFP